MSGIVKRFQLKIEHAKFYLITLPSINNVFIQNKNNYINCKYKNQKYASQFEKYQQQEKQLHLKNLKNHQQEISILKQLTLSETIMKAILNLSYYINSITTTPPLSLGNQFQQNNQRILQLMKKASTMITEEAAAEKPAAAVTCNNKNNNNNNNNNLLICQNQVINTRKLSQISDSDFFIFKAKSCENHLNNFIIEFINNINSLKDFFSFNLNIVLNGSDRKELKNNINSVIILNEYNKNINKIYSANIFGANFISKCLRFNRNFENFSNGDTNYNNNNNNLKINKMSKVATEQPPIEISKGNTNIDSTKELLECSSSTSSQSHAMSSVSSSSSSSSSSTTTTIPSSSSDNEKREKGSCFKSGLGEIIQFLELVGGLKHTKRTGFVLRDVKNCESISGHMYRMAMMTFLLDGTEGLNQTKCMELALVHDLAECIVGDLTPFCGVTKEEKKRMEMDAMAKICKLIEPRGKRMWELFVEYEGAESPESKFVKDLDRLDMVLQAFEYEKRDDCLMKHQEFFDSTEGKFEHNFVQELVKEIYDQREQLAKENGCTPNMYPQPSIIQNGHHNENEENVSSTTVQNDNDNKSPSSSVTTESNTVSEATTASSTTSTDVDQKKASNVR